MVGGGRFVLRRDVMFFEGGYCIFGCRVFVPCVVVLLCKLVFFTFFQKTIITILFKFCLSGDKCYLS